MLFLLASNPNLLNVVLLGLVVIAIGIVLRLLKQPYVVAYIIAGVLLGKHGFQMLTDVSSIQSLGEFGLILLLFFIGMEISLPNLLKNWKQPTFGTIVQIFASILAVASIGWFFGWTTKQIIFFGFAISLSSSAIVIKLLQDNRESQTQIGQSVINVLLMQDILIVPMLIIVNYLGGTAPATSEIILQIIGGVLIITGIVWLSRKEDFALPFSKHLEADHELQVFIAFILCFGFAVITEFFGLSAALGAFVAGLVVHAARSTHWFHDSLHSFRVLFVAIFFISIGMLIDLNFLVQYWKIIALLLSCVYLTNHFINTAILHYYGRDWKNSLYGGALLAQIGELSFVLTSSAFFGNIITNFEYQLIVITISLSLLISPIWIIVTQKIIGKMFSGKSD